MLQNAAYTVMMKAYLASDHVSNATGKTMAVTISKAGGAFGNPSVGASNASEVGNGWYSFALSSTDTNTLGDLVIRLTSALVDDAERVFPVTKANPDINIASVNSVTVNGVGTSTNPWGP